MKVNISIIFFISITLLSSCITNTFTSAPLEPIVKGHFIDTPINIKVLKKNIQSALITYNWVITDSSDDYIIANYKKSGGIFAEIIVKFNYDGYRIEYLDSHNLDYNKRRSLIHKNFNRWINNLNKVIYQNYMNSSLSDE